MAAVTHVVVFHFSCFSMADLVLSCIVDSVGRQAFAEDTRRAKNDAGNINGTQAITCAKQTRIAEMSPNKSLVTFNVSCRLFPPCLTSSLAQCWK